MNGVSINKVRPIGDLVVNRKPPKPEQQKNGRRPISSYINGVAKRNINSKIMGLKDLLFKGRKFGDIPQKSSKDGSSRTHGSHGFQLPINNI